MEAIRQTLLTNWHFMRWFRLGIGIFMAIQAVQLHDVILGLIGTFFLYQAITNSGCCGARGCAVGVKRNANNEIGKGEEPKDEN